MERVEVLITSELIDDVAIVMGTASIGEQYDLTVRHAIHNTDHDLALAKATATVLSDLGHQLFVKADDDRVSRLSQQQKEEEHKQEVLRKQRESAARARAAKAAKKEKASGKVHPVMQQIVDDVILHKQPENELTTVHPVGGQVLLQDSSVITPDYAITQVQDVPVKAPSGRYANVDSATE